MNVIYRYFAAQVVISYLWFVIRGSEVDSVSFFASLIVGTIFLLAIRYCIKRAIEA